MLGALKINREKSTDLPAITQYSIVSAQLAELKLYLYVVNKLLTS